MSTHVSCEDRVYKEDFLLRIVFFFFFSSCNLVYSIRNINLVAVSSVSFDFSVPATLVQRRPSLSDTSV